MLRVLLGLERGLQPVPGLFSNRATVVLPTMNPAAYNPLTRWFNDLVVHRNGDIGSPRISGATNASNASTTPGCASSPISCWPVPRPRGSSCSARMGCLSQVTKAAVERALAEELTEHLGYERHDPAGRGSGNSRNGSTAKRLLTDIGAVDLDVPQHRVSANALGDYCSLVRTRLSRWLAREVRPGPGERIFATVCLSGRLIQPLDDPDRLLQRATLRRTTRKEGDSTCDV